jgi:hypothetical protein
VHLFRIPTVSIVLAQSFLVGAIYYGNIFYVPMFFQYVMGYSALKTGTLTLAYTLPQSLYGIVSGFIISKTNWYKGVIIFGSAIWTLGAGLQIMWTPDSSLGQVIGILEVSSIGVGCCLQSSKRFLIVGWYTVPSLTLHSSGSDDGRDPRQGSCCGHFVA